MDAYGNLTEISEFSGGRRIRLISYLNEDVAIGGSMGTMGWYALSVHNVSTGDPEQSIFVVHAADRGMFTLDWGAQHGNWMSWEGDASNTLQLEPLSDNLAGDRVNPPEFTVDFVNGCWFALNDPKRYYVVDCSGSGTNAGNPITFWRWNGGNNQIWRAATIGPGLSVGSASDTAIAPVVEAGEPPPIG